MNYLLISEFTEAKNTQNDIVTRLVELNCSGYYAFNYKNIRIFVVKSRQLRTWTPKTYRYMVDEKKLLMQRPKMAAHANGETQYLGALLGGRYVTKKQTRTMVDFLFAGTKRNKSLQALVEYKSL